MRECSSLVFVVRCLARGLCNGLINSFRGGLPAACGCCGLETLALRPSGLELGCCATETRFRLVVSLTPAEERAAEG